MLRCAVSDDTTVTFRVCEASSPLQHAGGGDQTGAGRRTRQLPGLPPASVRLVDHLQQVSSAERHPCIRTRDGGVLQGAVVHHRPHEHLTDTEEGSENNDGVFQYRGIHYNVLYFNIKLMVFT